MALRVLGYRGRQTDAKICYSTPFSPDLSPSLRQREPSDASLNLFSFSLNAKRVFSHDHSMLLPVAMFRQSGVDLHGSLSLINIEQTPGKRLPIAQIHVLKHDDALLIKEARGRDRNRAGDL